jgi:hypothetical protein
MLSGRHVRQIVFRNTITQAAAIPALSPSSGSEKARPVMRVAQRRATTSGVKRSARGGGVRRRP